MHPLVITLVALNVAAIVMTRQDARFTAVVLLAGLSVTNIAWLFNSLSDLIALDMLMAIWGIWLVRGAPTETWRRVFAALAFVQLGLDTVYEWLGVSWYFGYMALYNLAFVAQLVTLGSTGAPHVFTRLARRWRRHRLSHRRVVS